MEAKPQTTIKRIGEGNLFNVFERYGTERQRHCGSQSRDQILRVYSARQLTNSAEELETWGIIFPVAEVRQEIAAAAATPVAPVTAAAAAE